MKEPFKCCWNCRLGGIRLHLSDKKQDDESAVTERLCMSLTEMQLHPGKVGPSKNPYIIRDCPEFYSRPSEINFGHEISEAEAKKLNTMTVAERLKYWWNTLNA